MGETATGEQATIAAYHERRLWRYRDFHLAEDRIVISGRDWYRKRWKVGFYLHRYPLKKKDVALFDELKATPLLLVFSFALLAVVFCWPLDDQSPWYHWLRTFGSLGLLVAGMFVSVLSLPRLKYVLYSAMISGQEIPLFGIGKFGKGAAGFDDFCSRLDARIAAEAPPPQASPPPIVFDP